MATIKDVAKRAKVSIATVSRVINETGYVGPDLEERVHEAISALGYQPNIMARHLRRSESLTLCVLIPDSNNPFAIPDNLELASASGEIPPDAKK